MLKKRSKHFCGFCKFFQPHPLCPAPLYHSLGRTCIPPLIHTSHTYIDTHTHTPHTDSEGGTDTEDESGGGGGAGGGGSNEDPLTSLHDKLKELTTAHDIVVKNHNQLTKVIGDLEEGGGRGKVKEQLALFKLTAVGIVKVSHYHIWK